jgi:long-chain acyl-CoA synthetase
MVVARGSGERPNPGTLTQLFYDAVERHDKPDALQVKIGGRYEPISHRTLADRVRHAGRGLQSLGLAPGARIGILSENRPEWAIADYACLTARFTDVTIYPTLPASQVEYILRDAEVVAIFVSTAVQAQKVADIRKSLPTLKTVISFESVGSLGDLTLAELERRGAEGETADDIQRYRADALTVKPNDLATLIYTSGTTGEPKGVMLTHDNIYSNVATASVAVQFKGSDTGLSFLPLSHIFERMAGHYLMFSTGTSIAYAESIDTVPDNMLEVRPTLMVSVPRLYEKMYARVLENAAAGGPVKLRIFNWASKVAERWTDVKVTGREPKGLLALQYRLANKLVFSKLQARTGGRMRYFVSGGAPLSPEINKFFFGAGLFILEGYGLTETSPVIAVNTPKEFRFGTVGKPFAGVEVAIADDGEILTRGPNVMKGYYNKPEATAQAIDAEGWFHTGDIGELTDGFLRITDRKKDLIVTAGGKNIAPQPIEGRVTQNKYVTQAVMIGDKRKFPAILIVPDFAQLEKWAKYKNISFASRAELIAKPEVQSKMEREVVGPLADLAHYEVPKKVVLLEHEFSLERGEMTPTLKVKRRVVDEHYKETIDRIYA